MSCHSADLFIEFTDCTAPQTEMGESNFLDSYIYIEAFKYSVYQKSHLTHWLTIYPYIDIYSNMCFHRHTSIRQTTMSLTLDSIHYYFPKSEMSSSGMTLCLNFTRWPKLQTWGFKLAGNSRHKLPEVEVQDLSEYTSPIQSHSILLPQKIILSEKSSW